MKKLDKKWQLILYGCAGLGLNMLNMIVGSYLCGALLISGFDPKDVGLLTYVDRDLVIAEIWATLLLVVKIFDGIIDIPLSSFTDNLRTRWGRRRPAILIGLIPTILAYVLFLIPITPGTSIANTIWFGAVLTVYYASYTLTMVTYYATFAEILKDEKDRVFVSNTKSICDVVYFSLSFALVPVFVNMGINIRYVALLFLPLAATMLIPIFMIKEQSTKDGVIRDDDTLTKEKRVSFVTSFLYAVKNKSFLYWLLLVSVMNIGLQLFLNGIDEFFSTSGLNMTVVMASAFAPVPFTLILYNKLVGKKGLSFAFRFVLAVFSAGMALMFFCPMLPKALMTPYAIVCGIIVSTGIGSFFSITYTIPAHMAAEQNAKGEVNASSMFFAVQGLFEGVAAGIASGPLLVFLKEQELISTTTVWVALFCIAAFVMAFFLPKSVALLGKKEK